MPPGTCQRQRGQSLHGGYEFRLLRHECVGAPGFVTMSPGKDTQDRLQEAGRVVYAGLWVYTCTSVHMQKGVPV